MLSAEKRLADILSCPFGFHIVCCLYKNTNKLRKIQKGDLFFSLEQRLVMIQNKVINLTVKEFDILAILIRHPKRVFTYEMIIELVWGKEYMELDISLKYKKYGHLWHFFAGGIVLLQYV